MAYTYRPIPKKKRKIPYRVIIFSIILTVLGMYILYTLFSPKELRVEQPSFTICDYNLTQTQAVLYDLKYEDTIEISDYLFYGETLNLFHKPYVLGDRDYLIGKTLILRDLCSTDEWVYMLDGSIDGQIPLENLPQGFYELFVVDQLVERRLIAQEQIYDVFYTIRRSGASKRVDIVADDDLIEHANDSIPIMNHKYFFIRVLNQDEDETMEAVYDITLDPAHLTKTGNSIDRGRSGFDLQEAQELLRFSKALQEKLASYGLKVRLSREDDEQAINLYGIDGRLHQAYQSQSKHYIEINMNFSTNKDIRGSRVVYSSYASNKFASAIFRSYSQIPGIVPYGPALRGNIAGVIASSRFEGFDSFPVVRESGGRILAAGTISEQSMINSEFNAEERQGMQTLILDLIFLSNELDTEIYNRYFDDMVESVAQGYLKFIGIGS